VNFVENCRIYSEEVLVNEVNGIFNYVKFTLNYDDLYIGITFWGHRVRVCWKHHCYVENGVSLFQLLTA